MSRAPKGEGVLGQLRRQIAANPFTEIEIDDVAKRFEVSRSHAVKIVGLLTHEGLLERAQVYRVPRRESTRGSQA